MQRSVGVAFRSRDTLYDSLKDFGDAYASFSRRAYYLAAVAADEVDDFVLYFFGFGRIEVYLVDYRNDFEVVVDSHVEVGYGLGLYALRGVDNEECAFACGDGARHLVRKVHVSGSVDEIECVVLAVEHIIHLNGVALDCDAAFALQIHVVEHLGFHIFGRYGVGIFQQSVGKGRLAMVDVGYYAEIAYIFHLSDICRQSYKKCMA